MNTFKKNNKEHDKKKLIKKQRDHILLNTKETCPYCSADVSLYNLKNQHFKSIKCKQMKKLFFQDPANAENTEHYILTQINKLIKETLQDS